MCFPGKVALRGGYFFCESIEVLDSGTSPMYGLCKFVDWDFLVFVINVRD